MWKDPIVEELRKNASKLAEEAGNTLHGFCEMIRREQSKYANKVVRRSPRRRLHPTGTDAVQR